MDVLKHPLTHHFGETELILNNTYTRTFKKTLQHFGVHTQVFLTSTFQAKKSTFEKKQHLKHKTLKLFTKRNSRKVISSQIICEIQIQYVYFDACVQIILNMEIQRISIILSLIISSSS